MLLKCCLNYMWIVMIFSDQFSDSKRTIMMQISVERWILSSIFVTTSWTSGVHTDYNSSPPWMSLEPPSILFEPFCCSSIDWMTTEPYGEISAGSVWGAWESTGLWWDAGYSSLTWSVPPSGSALLSLFYSTLSTQGQRWPQSLQHEPWWCEISRVGSFPSDTQKDTKPF